LSILHDVQRLEMDRKRAILGYLARRPGSSGPAIARHLGITRQALNLHLRELIRAGRALKSGSTRGARYSLVGKRVPVATLTLAPALRGLDEAAVYDRIALSLNLNVGLRANVEAILRYAFTEMLNNAVEHSRSALGRLRMRLTPATAAFEVRDMGIGIFHSIRSKLGLEDEHAALLELVKGRTTTLPEGHTGEGVFFTSQAADVFRLRSHRIGVEWSRARGDVFVSAERFLRGTRVEFLVERATRRRLEDVFARFAPAEYDYRFEKTRVLVKLVRDRYVSRSEAKRLVANLGKFREVVLDFTGVRSLGQGFADEVFRVFATAHPDTKVTIENAHPVVEAMIHHVAGPS
jgi:biotin operon repressor